jgi:predicted RNA-binding protein with PUA-like domain
VVSQAYPDPDAADNAAGKIVTVDVAPVRPLTRTISLAELKDHPAFADSPLVRISRLSVVPLTEDQYRVIAG